MKCFLTYRSLKLTGVGLLFSFTLCAQHRQDIDIQEWAKGIVTLTTGDVLEGKITYYRTQDIISVSNEDGTLSTLSPVNVAQFEVSDELSNRSHIFKSIFWDQGKDYTDFKKPTFFEQLNQGKATLLMRESYNKKTVDPYLASSMDGNTYDPLGYPLSGEYYDQIKPKFYILQPDGEIVKLTNIRKDFLSYCGKHASVVKAYARKQKLSFDLPQEFMAIVNYYNNL
ncbi:hypothetical protein H8S95_13825 [Pontibacter sp. KCTC 32443]|uniref:hypothetical protein n=1 Tax=Pontibacter TaxID=323449 RepID=UPI00164DC340|nr:MULTISPECIES: hypothetical protein [Pontibacter]MBC5775152.1 hypothetical protein [Pontibacter sp. KCTC 32443]